MSAYRVVSPYSGLTFDLQSYEIEVEKGKRRIALALLLNMLIVMTNIVTCQLTLSRQTTELENLIRMQFGSQPIPNAELLLARMTAILDATTYPLYVLLGQILLYIVIAVLPWSAIYLGKSWARNLVGFFATIQGLAGVLTGVLLLWYGWYAFATLALAYGAIKLYTVIVLFVLASVQKYFDYFKLQ